ncbi:MAG: peptidoglycan editing factor PgeF [Desulforhopalus sp.]
MNKVYTQQDELAAFPSSGNRGCCYGMFNRFGGVSTGPFASRNVGRNVGDAEEAVRENRRRIKELMGVRSLLSVTQVHGTSIYYVTEPPLGDVNGGEADAIITDKCEVGLMIQQADCQAVLLFDPVRGVIAAVHCGWRGSVQQILARVIDGMEQHYNTVPADLYAAISPSLGPCCAEFVNYKKELPVDFTRFMVRDDYFDFWQISKSQLVSCGMQEHRIRVDGTCSCCSKEYFSYRRAARTSGGVTGRSCSVISLKTNL